VAAQYQRSAALPGAEAGVAPALEATEQAQAASAYGEAASFLTVACELAAVESRQAAAGYLAEVASAFTNAGSVGHAWQLVPQGLAYADERDDAVWASLTLLELDRRDAPTRSTQGSSWMRPSAVRHWGSCTAPGRWPVVSTCSAMPSGRSTARASAFPLTWPRTPRSDCSSSAITRAPCRALPPRRPRRTPAASWPVRPIVAVAWPAATSPSASWRPAAPRSRRPTPWPIASRQGPWGWQLVHAILGTTDELAVATDEGWEEVLRLVEDVSGTRGQFVRWAQSAIIAGRARTYARLDQPDRALELLSAVLPALQRAASWGGPTRGPSAMPLRPCGCWTGATTCP
jgi:hypothetical protein